MTSYLRTEAIVRGVLRSYTALAELDTVALVRRALQICLALIAIFVVALFAFRSAAPETYAQCMSFLLDQLSVGLAGFWGWFRRR